ncbi:MAG: hypothetical protein IKE65_01975 [Clostridia bacterium]|nr:hypothetical protein [Clostridia bacterium]
MKIGKKLLSVVLAVSMLLSSMVFVLPQSFAATYPDNLYNGTQKVTYTATQAAEGKYLVEIDVVKYHPNITSDPEAIKSEAGDIILTYCPDNGTAPEVTQRFENVIAANAFNYAGQGMFTYYAVLEGFPQKATASVKKTNLSDNDSGIYAGIKIWNGEIGSFEAIFDFTKLERSNGASTAGLMFSNIESLVQYYPYAKQGETSGSNLNLPSGQTAVNAAQTFSVKDQWGVTMMAPHIAYTPVTGLTFSQNKNVMTVKGTGDANNPSANSRNVTLTATYDTHNTSVANTFSIKRTFTVYNSSVLTFAPTYANREKAGLGVSFKTSAGAVDKFPLNASYQATTENYVVLKNNASRKVTVTLSTTSSDKFSISTSTDTIDPGASKSFRLIDLKAANANYNADITVTYTIDGFYNASSGTLVSLTAGGTIPFVYNKVTTPDVRLFDENKAWFVQTTATVDVYCKYQTSHGVLNLVRTSGQSNNSNVQNLDANFYINTDNYSTYQSAGLGFYLKANDSGDYVFQPDESDAGYYVQRGRYDNAGTFGFSTSTAASAHTSRYCEKAKIDIPESGKFVPFYGTIFKGSTQYDEPAEIYFDGDQDNDDGLDIKCTNGIANSCYLNSHLYIYAYSKNGLRNDINSKRTLLSCYFNAAKWNDYCSMGNSKLRTAQIQLGTDVTSQYKISQAQKAMNDAYTDLIKAENTDNATYCLNHNKHTGDITTAIEQTSVDYYLYEVGASNVLSFNGAFSDACIKHSESFTPVVNAPGTYEHTYDYWNIDFTSLLETLNTYNTVAPAGQFVNVDDAVGAELYAAQHVDTTSATALPEKQTDVETIVNDLNRAMRDLVYTSYTMSVTHIMYEPTGTQVVDNDTIKTYTETYNLTTTYGEVSDGTADLSDGTYTIKGCHYQPQPDATFAQFASRHYAQGISSEYTCQEDKAITMVYYAKQIEDTSLKETITDVEDHIDEWEGQYTEMSIDAFVEWFDEHDRAGTFARIFSVFDQDEYNALLAEFMEEYDKLDPIAEPEQLDQMEQFMSDYEMLSDFSNSFCRADELLAQYSAAYETATQLDELSINNNAGKHATAALLDSVQNFTLTYHSEGAHKLLTTPHDGVDGSYYVMCSECSAMIDSGTLAAPHFNTYEHPAYSYANRGASLRVESESAQSDTQGMRFAASCKVPEDATVTDFGFVYTQTSNLNGGKEPADNSTPNVGMLVDGGVNVHKMSMKDGHYTIYDQDDGSVYTFNLVLILSKLRNEWNIHCAARSYITYELNGVSVTVYDVTYSSRCAANIAQMVLDNPYELPEVRNYIAAKFA